MSREAGQPQSGYTQLLEGSNLATARLVNVDMHHKHCYQVAKFIRGMNVMDAIDYLESLHPPLSKGQGWQHDGGPPQG